MLIIQFEISSIDDNEHQIIPKFCQFLIDKMYSEIDTRLNRRKIELRFNYLYKVPWIHWTSSKFISINDLMKTIYKSIVYKEYKDNIWKIEINSEVLIPNTSTSISRLIRFINSGDTYTQATGIFSKIENKYRGPQLISLWKLFILDQLGYIPEDTKIVTR